MRGRRMLGWMLTVALGVGLLVSPPVLADDDDYPEFKNPNPTFKPVPPAEEKRLAPIKLGGFPDLTEDEAEDIMDGDVILRELPHKGEGKKYLAVGLVEATPKECMALMKDYPLKKEYMPHMEEVAVKWDGNLATVDLELSIALSTIKYRLALLHYDDKIIEWEFVHGDIKDTTGYYKFFPFDGGAKTLVAYHVFSDPGMALPDFIKNMLTKSSMPGVIKSMREGIKLYRKKHKK